MFNKRGQVTIYIVLGLIAIITIFSFLYLNSYTEKTATYIELSFGTESIRAYVQSCISQTTTDGLYHVSYQGGYYDVPEANDFPHYFSLGETNFPEKSLIEKELSKYIKHELPNCVNDFKDFNEYEFTTKEISVESYLGETVKINVKYPVTIRKGTVLTEIEHFSHEEFFNFDRIYEITSNFKDEHQKNPDYVPIGYLSLLAYENDFRFDLSYYDDNVVLYSFVFDNVLDKKQPLLFNFAAKYVWSELE